MEVKSDAVKSNTVQEPGMLGPRIKANQKWLNSEMARVNVDTLGISKIKWTGMGEFTQMTIMSTTAGRNPSEKMEQLSWSPKESKMQCLDTVSKMTE